MAAAQSDDPCMGIIPYYSTELSRMAYTARKAEGFNSGRNVAVARVPGWNNPKTGDLVVGFSKGDGYHSEDHILDQLKAKNFKPSQITELYSERSPCDACKPKLAAVLEPGTPISRSVPDGAGSSDWLYAMIQALERPSFKQSAEQ
ncbi:nucleic acid/nucleotide deaminase domain-containing protein [Streptomyces lavendulae]|uniref:nucleic acid/nucleotide deaminase domain-containing protein n=1 Tax=Streptomyces lavendulae TaxID=1914 RepID=UPI0033FE5471